MREKIRYLIAIIGIIGAILLMVYGSYFALTKAKRYISALYSVSAAKNINDFKINFNNVLKFYSPIGDEEIAKFLSTDIGNLISQPNASEAAARELVNYIEPYMFKDNVRHLITLAQMYQTLWRNYGQQEADFKKAEQSYLDAFEIGPKLPPVLYGLLNLYSARGDKEQVKKIGSLILTYWPSDEKLRRGLEQL